MGATFHLIDSGFIRERLVGVYAVESQGEWILVDASAEPTVDRILSSLAELGCSPDQLRHLVLTHVHLDHAGGAGRLIQRCPQATAWVHSRGARHMVDPAKLIEGAKAVWGTEIFERVYGEVVPIPESRVQVAEHGASLQFGGTELRFEDAPGHAKHHLFVHFEAERCILAGDAFGLAHAHPASPERVGPSYPSTSPVQFDPEAMKSTIRRIASLQPLRVGVSHYGWLGEIAERADQLCDLVDQHVALAQKYQGEALTHALTELLPEEWRPYFDLDLPVNAQGLEFWQAQKA